MEKEILGADFGSKDSQTRKLTYYDESAPINELLYANLGSALGTMMRPGISRPEPVKGCVNTKAKKYRKERRQKNKIAAKQRKLNRR